VFTPSGTPVGSVGNLSPTVSPTTYTLTALNTGTGCTNTASVVVSMTPTPSAFAVTPATPAAVCVGSAAQLLTATGGVAANAVATQYNFGTGVTQNAASITATGYPAPYSLFYGGQRMQMLITAAELTAAGYISGSKITNVQFPVVSLGSNWGGAVTALNNYQVSIGATALTSLAAFQTGLTQVVAPTNFTPVVGYSNTHTFSSAFVWDGTSNVILETTFSNNIFGGANDVVVQYNTTTAYQSTIVYRSDNVTAAAAAAATTVTFSYSARPDFKLNGTTNLNPTIVWAPTTGLYTDAAATVPYTGTAASTVYAKPLLTQLYTATATVGACTRTATSNVLITPQPNATIAYSGTPYCASGIATVTVGGTTGTTGGVYSSTAGLVINAASGLVNLATSTAGTYTVTYTVAAVGGCSLYTTTTSIKINANGSWAGTVSSDWNNATNWLCGGVPTSTSNVIIPAGAPFYPIITTTASANNISIAAGASVVVNGAGVFNLYGTITNTGTFNLTAGTLNLAGTTAQTLAGTSLFNGLVKNLTLSNTAGISLSSALGVTGNVAFGTSNVAFATNNNLTLVSNAAGTASVNDITNNGTISGNTITGNVSIERYLPAKRAWRFLAAPVKIATSPTITNSWREGTGGVAGPLTSTGYGTRITGPAGTPMFDQGTQRASMKWFDMTFGLGDFRDITNTAAPIANEEGYFVFVRGDRSVDLTDAANITTLRIKGEVRTGTQPAFNVNNLRYKSIGNPYPSRIDFRTIAKTNIANQFTVWNAFNTGTFNAGKYEQYIYDGTDYRLNGSGVIRNYIESGEAIFIQNNDIAGGLGGSIIIAEKDKTTGSANVSRPGVTIPTLEINLHTNDVSGSDFVADGVVINFNNTFNNAIDNNDVRKIFNVADNLAIKSNNNMLIVERRKNPVVTDTIFLNLTGTRVANYSFEIDPSVLNTLGLNAFMKDKFLGTETPVSLVNVTNIPFAITTDAASKATNRFMIVFRAAAGPVPVRFVDIAAIKNANKTNTVKWNVGGELNIQQYVIERSDRGVNFASIGTTSALNNAGGSHSYSFIDIAPLSSDNYYRVKSIAVNGEVQYSFIVKLSSDETLPSITVYPNPITDRIIQVKFVNKAGDYTLKLLGVDGKTIQTQKITITDNNELKSIVVNKQVAIGNYDLMVSSATETSHIKIVIVQ
jgi:hypothetical protein